MRKLYILAIAVAAVVASALASMAIIGNSRESKGSPMVAEEVKSPQQQQQQQNGLMSQGPVQNTQNVKGSDGDTGSGEVDGD